MTLRAAAAATAAADCAEDALVGERFDCDDKLRVAEVDCWL